MGWVLGFPMLLVTVGLVPAGDLGGWVVGEDRKGLVDAFDVSAGSPEPPGSVLTWLNGFLGAGAGAEAEEFSLLGVARVTTRTPGVVGLVRKRILGSGGHHWLGVYWAGDPGRSRDFGRGALGR